MAKRSEKDPLPKDLNDPIATVKWLQRATLELAMAARSEKKTGTFLACVDRVQKGAALIATILNSEAVQQQRRFAIRWLESTGINAGEHRIPLITPTASEIIDVEVIEQ